MNALVVNQPVARLVVSEDGETVALVAQQLGAALVVSGEQGPAGPPGSGGGGTPGGSTTEIQFNDADVFAGDPDFTWVAGEGLTVKKHIAIGNDAQIDAGGFTPGSPDFSEHMALNVVEAFEGDFTGLSKIAIEGLNRYKHTGAGLANDAWGGSFTTRTDSSSTGDVNRAGGVVFYGQNNGSGDIASIYGLLGEFDHAGLGAAPYAAGAAFYLYSYDGGAGTPGTITDGIGVEAFVDWAIAGGVTNAYTFHATAPFSGVGNTNTYGLYIEDHSGIGATASENIRSKGVNSLNKFEGKVNIDGHVAIGNVAAINVNNALHIEETLVGDYSNKNVNGQYTALNYSQTGAGATSNSVAGIHGELFIKSTSIHDIDTAFGLVFFGQNDQSTSDIDYAVGVFSGFDHAGLGTIQTMVGAENAINQYDNGSGDPGLVSNMYGTRSFLAWYSGASAVTNAYTFYAKATDGGLPADKYYGLYIEDHSGVGSTTSENIHSAGTNSLNKFEGNIDVDGHVAVGNHGTLGFTIYAPGDPINESTSAVAATLTLNDNIIAGASAAAFLAPIGFESPAGSGYLTGFDMSPTINSDSVGNITVAFAAINNYQANFGAGDVALMAGDYQELQHWGSGVVSDLDVIEARSYVDPSSGGATTVRLLRAFTYPSAFPQDVVNQYGLYIDDQSGIGSSISENIRSKGATSLNVFEGILRLGTATNASPQNGDIWFDGSVFKKRVGGVTSNLEA